MRDLLRGFVEEDWVALLDFNTLEKVSGSYVSDDLRDREDDIIWRIRMHGAPGEGATDQRNARPQGEWVYVYLLLEFQGKNTELRRAFAVRINRVVLRRFNPQGDLPETQDLPEVQNMDRSMDASSLGAVFTQH